MAASKPVEAAMAAAAAPASGNGVGSSGGTAAPGSGAGTLPRWHVALAIGAPLLLGAGAMYLWSRRRRRREAGGRGDASGLKRNSERKTPEGRASPALGSGPDGSGDSLEMSSLDRAQAAKNKGNKYFKAGKYEQAIQCYTEAISLCPTEKNADLSTFYQNRAAAFEQLQKWKEVAQDCTKAVELNPKYVKALFRRAKAHEKLDNKKECLEDVTAVCILEGFQNEQSMLLADKVLKLLGKENAFFLDHVRTSFLLNLRRQLPRNVLDTSWPTPPPALREASELLRELCMKNMVWKYCRSISPEWKQQLQQKAVASEIFKGKKDNYPQSVPRLFISTRLGTEEISPRVLQALGSEPIQYAVPVVKYDRKGYKPRSRQLLLTPSAVVIVEDAKVKQRIDYANLTGISVSSLSDSLFVLHVQREDSKQKGDVVLQSDHVIETLTKTALSADRVNNININQGSITFAGGPGRDGIIDFTSGSELLITKAKNGHLAVVAPRLNSR